jgi:ribosomal protein S18 acetylase RimI-like enzyme
MFRMRYVSEEDKLFWFTLDSLLSQKEFELKIRDKRGYVICDGDNPVGILRYNLLWDHTPFLTLIEIVESFQRKGFGRKAMQYWENEMLAIGYDVVMISTGVDKQAQHFYRKLGYKENGGVFFANNMPFERPQEMFMSKLLHHT